MHFWAHVHIDHLLSVCNLELRILYLKSKLPPHFDFKEFVNQN